MAELSWRDLWHVRTALHRRLVDALAALPHPAPGGRTLRVGPDAIRILLVGAGAALGHGVTDSGDALDGAIADALHFRNGRGVVVENRSGPDVALSAVIASLGDAGTRTFDAVVWAPSYLEALERLSMRSWHRALTAMVHGLHDGSDVDVMLLLLPLPVGDHPVAGLARRRLPRINRVIEQVAAATPRTTAVPVESAVLRNADEPMLDREYYVRCAAKMLPTLLASKAGATAGR